MSVEPAVQSVDRAFRLLERMADTGGASSISDLAAHTGLPLPTIHRLVRSLVASGYVRQLPSRRYALGPAADPARRVGGPAARRLGGPAPGQAWSTQVGETANMAVLDGDAVVYVAQVPSPHSMRMFTEVGRRVLPHCTGVGKALLGRCRTSRSGRSCPHRHAGADRAHDHRRRTLLVAELAAIRRRGFAIDDGEQEPGVRCVAAAVPSQLAGTAALSVSGPSSRVTRDRVDQIAPLVIAATEGLVTTLGHHAG